METERRLVKKCRFIKHIPHSQAKITMFFTKQFTVGVLNATLDLAALVLVGLAAFFGSEMVLSPFGSLHVGWGA